VLINSGSTVEIAHYSAFSVNVFIMQILIFVSSILTSMDVVTLYPLHS